MFITKAALPRRTVLRGLGASIALPLLDGASMDQIAARQCGDEPQLASRELALEPEVLGACSTGYSCVYQNTIAWRTATLPLPMENNPRAVFERLFGASDSTDSRARV